MKKQFATSDRSLSFVFAGLLAGVFSFAATAPAFAAETESSIARGARLYDKFWAENKGAKPETDHAAYPHKGGKYGKDASWRCKECHGWDYMGKDGAYASGSHASGIKGLRAAAGKDPAAILAVIKDATHGYTDKHMSAQDMNDVALFVARGQIDMDKYIDRAAKKAKGDTAKGEVYFNTICAGCHGFDGKKVKDADPLGAGAGNPWELLHKVLNGHPGESMPAMRALDIQITVDLVAHVQTLSK